jgi:hypothetical protein
LSGTPRFNHERIAPSAVRRRTTLICQEAVMAKGKDKGNKEKKKPKKAKK